MSWTHPVVVFTLAGCFVLLPIGESHAQYVTDCVGETQQDMNECANQAFEEADIDLNELWKRIQNNFDDSDYDKRTRKALLKSQRAWISYRDAECGDQLAALQGGTGYPQFYAQWMERMTRQRIESLSARFVEG